MIVNEFTIAQVALWSARFILLCTCDALQATFKHGPATSNYRTKRHDEGDEHRRKVERSFPGVFPECQVKPLQTGDLMLSCFARGLASASF